MIGITLAKGETGKNRTWTELEAISNGTSGKPNVGWPEKCDEATYLTKIVRPASNGGAAEVATVNAVEGSIGYAAYPDALAGKRKTLEIQNNGQGSFETATFGIPGTGGEANCTATKYVVPDGGRRGEGTGLSADWSQVFGAKATIGGTAYPLCTLTFVLALNDYSSAGFSEGQEATAHDYLKEYVEASTGQADIVGSGKGYNGAPSSTVKANNVLGAGQFAAEKIGF